MLAILVENGLSSATLPFAPSILAALPSATTWTVPPDEVVLLRIVAFSAIYSNFYEQIKRRKDIRESHRVYSIDPIGCQDIDDALSLRFLPDEKYELGVRILVLFAFAFTFLYYDVVWMRDDTTLGIALSVKILRM